MVLRWRFRIRLSPAVQGAAFLGSTAVFALLAQRYGSQVMVLLNPIMIMLTSGEWLETKHGADGTGDEGLVEKPPGCNGD